jgi:hypothetical protein
MSNTSAHLKALMKKNWILFKRNYCCSLFEVFVPVLMVLFLLAIRGLVSVDQVDKHVYLLEAKTLEAFPYIDNATYNNISHLDPNDSKTSFVFDILYASHNLK